MTSDLFPALGRVRRTMPRNKDVMDICDALEGYIQRSNSISVDLPREAEREATAAGKLTRAEIQRAYRLRKKEQKP
jgi:hypothetical protein